MRATVDTNRVHDTPLLEVQSLVKHFGGRGGLFRRTGPTVRAVDGISFFVREGETLGIVGESGCGKSTTSRLIINLLGQDSGSIRFLGREVGGDLPVGEFRRNAQMVFQNSYGSLNPRLDVHDNIAFGLKAGGMGSGEAKRKVVEVLQSVGLPAATFLNRYPHQLSGGQRQRVNIARALVLSPKLVILDEPVSALDKSVQAQVLNLLTDLRRDQNLTYIFISHDLDVVRYISDRVLVMYLGKVVEIAPVDDLYRDSRHPYTRALISAMPSTDPDRRTQAAPLAGDPPNPVSPPSGCRFRTRCAYAEAICAAVEPALSRVGGRDHHATACHMQDPASGHTRAAIA